MTIKRVYPLLGIISTRGINIREVSDGYAFSIIFISTYLWQHEGAEEDIGVGAVHPRAIYSSR